MMRKTLLLFWFFTLGWLSAIDAQTNLTFAIRQGDLIRVNLNNSKANTNFSNIQRFNAVEGVGCEVDIEIYYKTITGSLTILTHSAQLGLQNGQEINYFITVEMVNNALQVVLHEANRSPICSTTTTNNPTVVVVNPTNPTQVVVDDCPAIKKGIKMTQDTYGKLLKQVKDGWESEKVGLIQSAVANANITTEMAIGLINELTFDDPKLELAKMFYDILCDRERFFLIRSSISSYFTQQKFDEFVKSKGGK